MQTFHDVMLHNMQEHELEQIAKPKPNTWTLFITTPRCKSWGFLQPMRADEAHGTLYSQPLNTAAAAGWESSVPMGKDAGRKPCKLAPESRMQFPGGVQ